MNFEIEPISLTIKVERNKEKLLTRAAHFCTKLDHVKTEVLMQIFFLLVSGYGKS